MSFLLSFIFQTHTACLKNGDPSMGRTQVVFQQPAKPSNTGPEPAGGSIPATGEDPSRLCQNAASTNRDETTMKDETTSSGGKPSQEQPVEEKILRMLKRVLTDIAKDTSTPPGMKHPLSTNTIQSIRDCLNLISARETELAAASGRSSKARPEYVDEPKKTHVVTLHRPKKKPEKKESDKPH